MGMFDHVNFKVLCPYCEDAIVDYFQTKSRDCNLDLLEVNQAEYFYASCPKCNAWVHYEATKVKFSKHELRTDLKDLYSK